MIGFKKDIRGLDGLFFLLLLTAASFFTCEKVPEFCGRGEKYDPGRQFCFGGAAHDKCGVNEYNPLVEGCVTNNENVVGTRCQDYTVVPKGTPCGGYTLTTAAAPAVGGRVERFPDEPRYAVGDTVQVAAEAEAEYEFVAWAGAGAEASAATALVKEVVMNSNKPMVAMFKRKDGLNAAEFTLITAAFPENGGTVTAAKETYAVGEEATVTAAENPGYEFAGWSGTNPSKNRTVTFTMNNSQTLVAVFTPKSKKLTVNANPGDGGAVFVNGAALSGITNQDAGTDIVLWAKAADGWFFSGWSGVPNGMANPVAAIKLTDGDMTVAANFSRSGSGNNPNGGGSTADPPAKFKITANTNYGGRVDLSPNDPKGEGYMMGTSVTATAVPMPGFTFSGWRGASTSKNNVITIAMDEDKTLTAAFTDGSGSGGGNDSTPGQTTYLLSTSVSPSAGGTLTISPRKPSYELNDKVTVTAAASSGYTFDGWSGAASGTANSVTVTMNGNKTLTAKFTQTATPSQEYTITLNPNKGTVAPTTVVTKNAKLASWPTPTRSGYAYDGWFTDTIGGSKVTTSTEFTGNDTIYAQWTPVYTITFNANGGTPNSQSVTTGAGGKLTTALPKPTKSGYSLVGWFTDATDGELVTANMVFTDNTAVYARWTKIIYTVTFNTGIGTVSPTSMIVNENNTLDELPTPTGDGDYYFDGWYTTAMGSTKDTKVTENKTYTANTDLYARWTPAESAPPGLVFDLDNFKKGIFYTGGWYANSYSECSNGTASTNPANVADYSSVFAKAGGKVTLNVSNACRFDPIGALVGIMWFDGDGLATNMDISGYRGAYITYSLTGNATVYMQISSEQISNNKIPLTEYNEYQTRMTPSASVSRAVFNFSSFEQDVGWGTIVPLSDVLGSSHGFNFQITTDGSATLTITRVELYK